MPLPTPLRRLWKRLHPDRIGVDLDVVEQLVLGHLIRSNSALAQDLREHVLAFRRTANELQVRLSLVRLESLHLIERVPDDSHADEPPETTAPGGRRYRITRDGKRLKVVIPAQPRSSIQTHV